MASFNLAGFQFEIRGDNLLFALAGVTAMNIVLTWGLAPIIFEGFAVKSAVAKEFDSAARSRDAIQSQLKDIGAEMRAGFRENNRALSEMRIEGRRNQFCEAQLNRNREFADDLALQIARLRSDYERLFGFPFVVAACPPAR